MNEETPEQRWNRIQKKIQNDILTEYPNPDRCGCPSGDVILDLAQRAAAVERLENDGAWAHVTHCSPCYREFLDARERLRRAE